MRMCIIIESRARDSHVVVLQESADLHPLIIKIVKLAATARCRSVDGVEKFIKTTSRKVRGSVS